MKKILLTLLFTTLTFAQSELIIVMGGVSYEAETLAYQTRVLADGGEIINLDAVNAAYLNAKANDYLDSLKHWSSPSYGVKKDASGKITTLYDLTSTESDLVQADTSMSPIYTANDLNAYPVSYFRGTDDYVKVTIAGLEQPETIIHVAKYRVWANATALSDGNGFITGTVGYMYDSSPNTALIETGVGSPLAVNTNFLPNTYAIILATYNGASSTYQVNNTAATTGDGGASDMGGLILGAAATNGTWASQSNIGETMIFQGNLSSSKRTIMKSFLNTKYSIY